MLRWSGLRAADSALYPLCDHPLCAPLRCHVRWQFQYVCCVVRWIVEAMKLEYGFGRDGHTSINNLSPSRIKQLLLQVVSKQPDANGLWVHMSCWQRQCYVTIVVQQLHVVCDTSDVMLSRGTPLSPLVHLLPHLFPFLLFPFFPWLYLFSSFVHPFPFYQNSPTPFPGLRS